MVLGHLDKTPMNTVVLIAHVVQPNGWVPNEVTTIEFRGHKLVEFVGFRGAATVYKTEKGKLAIHHDQSGFPEKVFRVHTDLVEVAKFTEGRYPIYDDGLVAAIADALGTQPPPQRLDI